MRVHLTVCSCLIFCTLVSGAQAQQNQAHIDGEGPGWRALQEADFENVNCAADTWSWKEGVAHCSGTPTGVIRLKKPLTNFELVAQWRHLKPAGNSGIFVWGTADSLAQLKPGGLPQGFEVQVLDTGYTEQYEKQTGKKADWFTTHGDVFPVGDVKMNCFEPRSPAGNRSFPRQQLSQPSPQWNHYYVRAINGEIRLWVNGQEVAGGSDCQPRSGYLCLESEGSPVEFRNLKLRELP
jgi:hypothetical protein